MYVYVTKFANYPDLIKIGKSKVPEGRTAQLTKWHGDVITTDVFYVGEDYSKVEGKLHLRYKEHQVRTHGDGATEFFSDTIYDKVCKELENKDCKESLVKTLNKEEIRYKSKIGRLLGSSGKAYTFSGSTGELHAGWFDCMKLLSCIEIGFSDDEVFSKFVSGKEHKYFTTPKRVGIAYNLFTKGTSKSQQLQKLIFDCG